MRSLYLVRHGKPQYPDEHSYCIGQTDCSLSMLGHCRQSFLTKNCPIKYQGYTAVLIKNCRDSQSYGTWLPHIIVSDLSERNLGEWDGLSFDEIRQRWPAFIKRVE